MITVTTKNEFEQAILNRESKILCKGEAAKPFLKQRKRKRGAIIGGAVAAIAGIAVIPLTGGLSAIGSMGVIAGLTAGTLTITAAELAIICGTAIAITGILKGGKVRFVTSAQDGSVSVEFEPQYKD